MVILLQPRGAVSMVVGHPVGLSLLMCVQDIHRSTRICAGRTQGVCLFDGLPLTALLIFLLRCPALLLLLCLCYTHLYPLPAYRKSHLSRSRPPSARQQVPTRKWTRQNLETSSRIWLRRPEGPRPPTQQLLWTPQLLHQQLLLLWLMQLLLFLLPHSLQQHRHKQQQQATPASWQAADCLA